MLGIREKAVIEPSAPPSIEEYDRRRAEVSRSRYDDGARPGRRAVFDEETYARNVAHLYLLRESIEQTYPKGHHVAVAQGKVVADAPTPEDVAAHLPEILDTAGFTVPGDRLTEFGSYLGRLGFDVAALAATQLVADDALPPGAEKC